MMVVFKGLGLKNGGEKCDTHTRDVWCGGVTALPLLSGLGISSRGVTALFDCY